MASDSGVEIWATAISTDAQNGRKTFWRFAKDLRPNFDRSSQPDRIILAWNYESENGQPNTEEHRWMNLMEDALEKALDHDDVSTLALVSTGEGLREWTYYVKDEDEFIDRLNLALAGMPVFPIDIHRAHDPEWSMWEQFKGGVRVTPMSFYAP